MTARMTRLALRVASGLAAAIVALPILVLLYYAAEPIETAWAMARVGLGHEFIPWGLLFLAWAGVVAIGAAFGRLAALGWDPVAAGRATFASGLTAGIAMALLVAADAGSIARYSPASLHQDYNKHPLNMMKSRMMDNRTYVFMLAGCADVVVIVMVLWLSTAGRSAAVSTTDTSRASP